MKLTWLWLVFMLAFLANLIFSYDLGFFHYLFSTGYVSFSISILILVILVYALCSMGRSIYRAETALRRIDDNSIDTLSAISNMCVALGLLGTVIGLILMSHSFANIDINSDVSVAKGFGEITQGMAIALYTTLFGQAANIVIKFWTIIIKKVINR